MQVLQRTGKAVHLLYVSEGFFFYFREPVTTSYHLLQECIVNQLCLTPSLGHHAVIFTVFVCHHPRALDDAYKLYYSFDL